METKTLSRVAPFWRDVAILLVGTIIGFWFGINFARNLPQANAATPASAVVTTTTSPKAAK